MNLIIDIGNTNTKLALFENNQILRIFRGSEYFSQKILNLIKQPKVVNVMLSAVQSVSPLYLRFIRDHSFLFQINKNTPLPIKNKYKTPETLGKDRLANAVAGASLFPNKNVLIIDMGTCIKFDFIDKNNNYHGGSISPGVSMRFRALHIYTGKLPLIKPSKKFSLTGKNTQESILSGVQNGIIFEINGMLEQYQKKYDELKVILTGGDAPFFADHLKSSIFAAPNLTLQGLNEILNYNIRKKER